ncbi:hypothetical protein LCGC14_1005880 [marine sediment metagenome]|uniref:GIY-YIG domain-containing protein n=1 Tax=marine sediment metagenome TaxID=412755 RepID=A0A0F9N6C0_9ZZZZ
MTHMVCVMNQQSFTSKYIVYALRDPINNEVRYIGKSCSGLERPRAHTEPHRLKLKSKKNSWIKNLLNRGLKPKITILAQCMSEKSIEYWERNFISSFKRRGKLTNMTEGGTGGNTGGSWKKWKPVISTNIKSGEKKYYLFVQATRFDSFLPTKVSAVCQGKRHTHKKHKFKYAK